MTKIIQVDREAFGFTQTVLQVFYFRPDAMMFMPKFEVLDIPFGSVLTAVVDYGRTRFILLTLTKES